MRERSGVDGCKTGEQWESYQEGGGVRDPEIFETGWVVGYQNKLYW